MTKFIDEIKAEWQVLWPLFKLPIYLLVLFGLLKNVLDLCPLSCQECGHRLSKVWVNDDSYYYFCSKCEDITPW
jgi:hypothetical protein